MEDFGDLYESNFSEMIWSKTILEETERKEERNGDNKYRYIQKGLLQKTKNVVNVRVVWSRVGFLKMGKYAACLYPVGNELI